MLGQWIADYFLPLAADTWSTWPFGPGEGKSSWLFTLTQFLFMGVIFAGICLYLRFLFGPGGPLREDLSEDEDKPEGKTGDDPGKDA